jgi:hypothetical protein
MVGKGSGSLSTGSKSSGGNGRCSEDSGCKRGARGRGHWSAIFAKSAGRCAVSLRGFAPDWRHGLAMAARMPIRRR